MHRTTGYLLLRRSLLLAPIVVASSHLLAGDWPQWRGPDRTDVSTETGLLQEWPEGGPKRVWLFDQAGIGYSGFAVVGGVLYTMGARDGAEELIAIDARKGEELWKTKIGDVFDNKWGDGPRGTPTVADGRIYAIGAAGGILCADAKSGKEVWRRTMQELGGKTPGWGYTESILVDDGKVLCTPGGDEGAIAALDPKTGKTIWQTKEFTDPAHYSSLIAYDHDGKRQYAQLTEKSVVGITADGKVAWRSDWPGRVAVIPTPIYSDGKVYVTSGYGVGCKLIEIGADGSKDLWDNKVMKNHHGGVVKVGDHLYGHSDGAGWVCQDWATGEMVWNEKRALDKGCTSFADGRLYCVDERTGDVALAGASTEGWKEYGRFRLDPQTKQRKPDGRIWTHPVISNGHLYLRDQEYIYCFDVRAEK